MSRGTGRGGEEGRTPGCRGSGASGAESRRPTTVPGTPTTACAGGALRTDESRRTKTKTSLEVRLRACVGGDRSGRGARTSVRSAPRGRRHVARSAGPRVSRGSTSASFEPRGVLPLTPSQAVRPERRKGLSRRPWGGPAASEASGDLGAESDARAPSRSGDARGAVPARYRPSRGAGAAASGPGRERAQQTRRPLSVSVCRCGTVSCLGEAPPQRKEGSRGNPYFIRAPAVLRPIPTPGLARPDPRARRRAVAAGAGPRSEE